MSKNGKLIFKNFDPYITSTFGNRINPITGKNQFHQGVDYGTNDKKLAQYAIEYGEITGCGTDSTGAKYVYVKYPRLGKTGLHYHLDSYSVKNGQKVDSNTIIGYTGETGQATGIHLHFGWFKTENRNKAWNDKGWEDFEKYEYTPPISYLGSPVQRNEVVSQYEITVSNLRVRKEPNGEILGYINPGFYNILEEEQRDDYLWIKISANMWVAYSEEFGNLYLKEENIEDNDDDLEEENTEKEEEKDDTSKEDDENNTTDDDNADDTSSKNSFFKRFITIFLEIVQKILKFFKIL